MTPIIVIPTVEWTDDGRFVDAVALPMPAGRAEDILRRIDAFHSRRQQDPALAGESISVADVEWYACKHPTRGWLPLEFSADDSYGEEDAVEGLLPAFVHAVEHMHAEIVGSGTFGLLDRAGDKGGLLNLREGNQYVSVGPGVRAPEVLSEALPTSLLHWVCLYWAHTPKDASRAFAAGAELDPTRALDAIERGMELPGSDVPARRVRGLVRRDAFMTLLQSKHASVRERASLAVRHLRPPRTR